MSIKRKNVYEIIIISLVIILTSLCAYMGITAIQKSMKLKMSFNATPSILVKIELYNTTTSQWDIIFQNSGTIKLGDGLELSGNTLKFTNSFANTQPSIGASFDLRFTNLMTVTGLKVNASGTGATGNPTYVTMGKSGTAEMTISGNSAASTLQLSFSEFNAYSVTFSNTNDCTAENMIAEIGKDFITTITPQTTFAANYFEYDITINGEPYTHYGHSGTLIIPAEDITGEIDVSVSVYECWDGTTSGKNYTPVGTNSTATYSIDSPADLAQMIQSVNNKNLISVSLYNNVTFNLTKDIYLNDEDFIFEDETGYVYITDGVNEGWLGTGAGDTVRGTWKNEEVYSGLINEWSTIDGNEREGIGFEGCFDGRGCFVSGVYQLNTFGGLFGVLGANHYDYEEMEDCWMNVEFKNIGIINSFCNGAAFSDVFRGDATNVYSDIIVCSNKNSGGVFGNVIYASSLLNCYNNSYVLGGHWVGGIVYDSSESLFINCVNNGYLKGLTSSYEGFLGGIVGANGYGNDFISCYHLGDIAYEVPPLYIGAIISCDISSSTSGCYFLQTDTINAGLEVYPGYTGTDCGTVSSIDQEITLTIYALNSSSTTSYTGDILGALNKTVAFTASNEYKTWQSINPPKFGNFWSV